MCLEAFCSRRKQKCGHLLELWGPEKKIYPGSLEALIWDLYQMDSAQQEATANCQCKQCYSDFVSSIRTTRTLFITFDLWQGDRDISRALYFSLSAQECPLPLPSLLFPPVAALPQHRFAAYSLRGGAWSYEFSTSNGKSFHNSTNQIYFIAKTLFIKNTTDS